MIYYTHKFSYCNNMYLINSDFVIKTGYILLLAYIIVNHMYVFTQMLGNISRDYMASALFLITIGLVYITIKVGKSETFGGDKLPSFLFITLAVPSIILSGLWLYDLIVFVALYVKNYM